MPTNLTARASSKSPARRARDADSDEELTARVLGWNELFRHWPEPQRRALLGAARLERYRRRTLVMAHGRGQRDLLLVVSGAVEVGSLSALGRKYVNALLGPGQVAPLVRLLEDNPLGYDYHAHEDSVIVRLPADAVLAQLDAHPALWREVARLALQRQRISVAMLQGLTLGTVRRRLAATLISLAEFYGAPQEAGLDLRVRLPQQDLAALLGVSRQTVNKQLRALAQDGLVEMAYKRLTLLDVQALTRIAAEQ